MSNFCEQRYFSFTERHRCPVRPLVDDASDDVDVIFVVVVEVVPGVRAEVDQLVPGEEVELVLAGDEGGQRVVVCSQQLHHHLLHLRRQTREMESIGRPRLSVNLEAIPMLCSDPEH